jgi:hypothetical protein
MRDSESWRSASHLSYQQPRVARRGSFEVAEEVRYVFSEGRGARGFGAVQWRTRRSW